MIDEKCKHCSELVIPYFGLFSKSQLKLPDDLKEGTCKCNMDLLNRMKEGYYGWCHPDLCKGPEHRYTFNYNTPNRDIIFID